MILPDRWEIHHRARRAAGEDSIVFGATAAKCQAWIDDRPDGADFEAVRVPFCSCCGEMEPWGSRAPVLLTQFYTRDWEMTYRCPKHLGSNPCAVEGCPRWRGLADGQHHCDDVFLCTEHWKLACPPRSPARLVYRRIWRLHEKRDGKGKPWSEELGRRLDRIWAAIVRRARSATAGDIDMDEINKLFGWE